MAQLVTVDPDGTQSLHLPGDGALPAAAASGQADDVRARSEVGRVLVRSKEETHG